MAESREERNRRIAKRFLEGDAPCRVSVDGPTQEPMGYKTVKVSKEELHRALEKHPLRQNEQTFLETAPKHE